MTLIFYIGYFIECVSSVPKWYQIVFYFTFLTKKGASSQVLFMQKATHSLLVTTGHFSNLFKLKDMRGSLYLQLSVRLRLAMVQLMKLQSFSCSVNSVTERHSLTRAKSSNYAKFTEITGITEIFQNG